MTRTNRKGFTLIEILIVVIILGILAAIVIPQFTNASKEAKQSSLVTQVQSLRSQIALFKLQHNDYLPGVATLGGGTIGDNGTVFWDQMTLFTNVTGGTASAKNTGTGHVFGPYMQSKAKNPLCPTLASASFIEEAGVITNNVPVNATNVVGFIYDYGGGAGSGKIWGTDTDGKTPVQQ